MKSTINSNNFRHWSDFKSRAEVSDYITSLRFSSFLTDSENMSLVVFLLTGTKEATNHM